jgi:hypothetical protein
MSEVAVRRDKPSRYRLPSSNTMAFPRELRDAIPDLPTCVGRLLRLDSMTATQSTTGLFGPQVHLSLVVKETGRLKGRYTVRMDLVPEAARRLAETLQQLADQADPTPPEL